jgi:hypothetical protein
MYIHEYLSKSITFCQCNYKSLEDVTIQNINQPNIKLKSDFHKPKMEKVNVK